MNYYAARQHVETTKWKYTMMNDTTCYEVGYCAGDRCPGHDTKEEACEHYKQYLLDTRLHFYNPTDGNEMRKCEVCGKFTFGHASLDMHTFILCEEHQTKEIVSQIYGKVGESISSY